MNFPASRRRILVVEDTDSDREIIARFLAEDPDQRNVMSFATTIEEGIALAKQAPFDLALVDWLLPDGPGTDFGARLNELGIEMPFVLMTGQTRPHQIDDAFSVGAVDFLAKTDLSARNLARTCEHAVVRARLGTELAKARQAEIEAVRLEREARTEVESALATQARLTQRTSHLYLLSSLYSAALTRDEVVRALMGHMAVFGRVDGANVYLLQRQELILEQSSCEKDLRGTAKRVPLSSHLPAAQAALRGEVVRTNCTREAASGGDAGVRDSARESIGLAMPLRTDGDALGVIELWFPGDAPPLPDELDFIKLVTELTAQAIVRASLFEEAAQRVDFERRLLAIVGHDLRTPLSAIMTGVNVLTLKYAKEPVLDRMTRSARRMAELIDDIMSRSDALAARAPGDATSVLDLAEVVQDAALEFRAAFPEREIAVRSLGPASTQANRGRLTQALANLVRNAVQYGRPGTPVTISFGGSSGQEVDLAVHNHGDPIASDLLQTIFDPFRRGRHAEGRGVGLGLFIVNELVASMGGRVSVTSGVAGTRFTIHLRARLPTPG